MKYHRTDNLHRTLNKLEDREKLLNSEKIVRKEFLEFIYKDLKISMYKLSDQSFISRTTLYNFIYGKKKASDSSIQRLERCILNHYPMHYEKWLKIAHTLQN